MTRLEVVKLAVAAELEIPIEIFKAAPARRRQSILAIGAHPDDVELGIGGILAAHQLIGDQITILTLSDGVNGGTPSERHQEALNSAGILGATLMAPGMKDSEIGADLEIIRAIEKAVAKSDPDIIYTHSAADTHQDHRSIHFASLVAGRGVAGLYCYGAPSLTSDFHPVRFNDITPQLPIKLRLLQCFVSQQHRSYFEAELVIAKAKYWGSVGRWPYAEPLEVIHERSPGHVELVGYVERSAIALRSPLDDEPQQHPKRAGVDVIWK